jgi:hypothetical protein
MPQGLKASPASPPPTLRYSTDIGLILCREVWSLPIPQRDLKKRGILQAVGRLTRCGFARRWTQRKRLYWVMEPFRER